MLKYFINILCLILSIQAFSQETTETPKSENYNPKTYGLRIGVDLIKPVLNFTNDNFNGGEIVADFRLNTKTFLAGELGYTKRSVEEDYYNSNVNGTYFKIGLNYNLYTNWLDMDNELFIGFRYGVSVFDSELENYTIAQQGTYFSPKTVNTNTTYNNLNTHWLDLVTGLKVEVLKNLYLGIMVNISKVISDKEGGDIPNSYSPGIGEISKNGSGSNINYTISYRIPLYKK
ncbi:DUF6048 family protein [Flavobacteriaceae bacterium]|nr:DUF6048 family protein [Flavobacteriaceae bacterium]